MHHINSAVRVVVVTIGVLSAQPHLGAADAGATCLTGGQLVYNNSVYDPETVSGVPTAGPKFPNISSREMYMYGSVGSCVVDSASEGFDGGEIVVGATVPMTGPYGTYGKILRQSVEIFLKWLNLERKLPGHDLAGGLLVGGKRYSMRFAWTDDRTEPAEAAAAITHSIRREDAHFGWSGYSTVVSRLQAEQTELDGVLLMAPAAAGTDVFRGKPLTFGALPPDYTYLHNAVHAAAQAAENVRPSSEGYQDLEPLKMGLVYHPNLKAMCDPLPALAQSHGMSVADWSNNKLDAMNPNPNLVDDVLRRLQAAGANFIVSCNYYGGGAAIIESLERLDFAPQAVATMSTVDKSEYQTRVNQLGWWQGEYVLGVSPWHSSLTVRGDFSGMNSAEFLTRYEKRYNELPSYHGPAAFSAACALANAIEKAGSLNANDVAASLREGTLTELGFGSPMNFAVNNGQNSPEMLVIQNPPSGTRNLKITYPRENANGKTQYPTPSWGKRRCIALGSGRKFGDTVPLDERPVVECSGKGTCELADDEGLHEVYECSCDFLQGGDNCETNGLAILIVALVLGLCLIAVGSKYFLSKRSKRKQLTRMRDDIETMKKSMTGVFIIQKALPSRMLQTQFKQEAILRSPHFAPSAPSAHSAEANPESIELTIDLDPSQPKAYFDMKWYWEEDAGQMGNHQKAMTLIHKGENFVEYSHAVSNEIEACYQLWLQSGSSQGASRTDVDLTNRISTTGTEAKANNAHTGCLFEIRFDTMKQVNKQSAFARNIKRVRVQIEAAPDVADHFAADLRASDVATDIPPLPNGVNFMGDEAEAILAARPGQIVQVAREHEDRLWLYGSVLVDAPGASTTDTAGSVSTGWFPRSIAQVAGAEDLKRVAEAMGGGGAAELAPPDCWQNVDKNTLQIFEVPKGSAECTKVEEFFLHTLKSHPHYHTVKVCVM